MNLVADVVVVGDGPAGSALARACIAAGVDAVLVGPDEPWTSTYGSWHDELDLAALVGGRVDEGVAGVSAAHCDEVDVWTTRRQVLRRRYVVLDNARLRATLRRDVPHRYGRALRVEQGPAGGLVHLDAGGAVRCRLVVDARGSGSRLGDDDGARPRAWQTAFGVVLDEPPPGDLGRPTLMDLRPAGAGTRIPTFAYSVPTADGWLVEETVLAARPAVDPADLRAPLAARLGVRPDDLLDRARRVEHVTIPVGVRRPPTGASVIGFGASAGYVNPVSGYSVAHSLRSAPAVAAAISVALGAGDSAIDARHISDALWPRSARATRVLHDYGLDVLLAFDAEQLRSFFAAFFDLPTATWAAYLRTDSPPSAVAGAMAALFRSTPSPIRRRLLVRRSTGGSRVPTRRRRTLRR